MPRSGQDSSLSSQNIPPSIIPPSRSGQRSRPPMKTILFALLCVLVPTLCAAQDSASTKMVHPNLYYWKPPDALKPQTVKANVCIYGGNSGGVIAAIQLRRL